MERVWNDVNLRMGPTWACAENFHEAIGISEKKLNRDPFKRKLR